MQLGRAARPARSRTWLTIDIDLLVYDLEFVEDDLWSQAYRAMPVAELLPDLRCPATGETVLHAANRLAGSSPITPRPEIFAPRTSDRDVPDQPKLLLSDPDSMTNQTGWPEFQPAAAYVPESTACLQVLRSADGRVCHRAHLQQFHRGRKGRPDRVIQFRRGRCVLPAVLPLRRHSHGGLWLRSIAQGDLGWVFGPGVRNPHDLGDPGPSASGSRVAKPAGLGNGLLQLLADRGGFVDGVSGGRVGQFGRAGQDENHDRRASPLVANDRVDHGGRAGRLGDLLPAGVSGGLGNQPGCQGAC